MRSRLLLLLQWSSSRMQLRQSFCRLLLQSPVMVGYMRCSVFADSGRLSPCLFWLLTTFTPC